MTFSIIVVLSKGIEGQDRQPIFKTCFDGLIGQSYPKGNYELVLVDSGSGIDDRTVRELEEEGRQSGVAVSFVQPRLGNLGPARGRNQGIKAVSEGRTKLRSEVIAFTDDDTLVSSDWLRKLEEGYKNFLQAAGVGGLTLPDEDLSSKNIFAFYDRFIYSQYPQPVGPSKSINEHPVFSGNISYKREVLEQAGGFDESYASYVYGEDADLKERVVKNGGLLVFADTISRHLAIYNWRRFVKQQESRGAGILKYRLKHNLKFPSRLEIIIRLILTPGVFFVYLGRNYSELKISMLETLAYFFRQTGKLRYYTEVRGQGSEIRNEDRDKKRLLFVDHTPLIGGAQLALLRHLKYLDKSRFDVSVVTSGDQQDFNHELKRIGGVKFYQVELPRLKNYGPFSLVRFLFALLTLIRIAKNDGSKILVANTERAFYACFFVCLVLNRKLIVIMRDFEYSKLLLRLTAFKVSKFICVSRKIRSFYGFNSSNSQVVYVGSDFDEQLKVMNDQKEQSLRSGLDLTSDSLVIGFVGRLISWKGPELLLRAFAKLCESQKKLKLIFVGDGPQKESLQGLAESLGVKEKVFFPGFIKEVAVWYRIFDIFVHASIKDEPFATTVIEAALAGLPIVATNTGGTAEFIENDVNGLLAEPEEESLVNGIKSLIDNENLRLKLAAAARQKAQTNFTEKQITKKLEKIYDII